MDGKTAAALFLVSFVAAAGTAELVAEQDKAGASNNKSLEQGQERERSRPENEVAEPPTPEKQYQPDWWNEDSYRGVDLMKTNFCQESRIAVATELTPYYEVCLNKDGFRDINYSVKKPEGTTRIAALGDAVTFGQGVENNETWPSYLQRSLERRYPSQNFQVMNYGIPFVGTKQEVIWFNRTGRKYDPDIVVLQYMDNDPQNLTRVSELTTRYRNRLPENASESKLSQANRRALKVERMERKNMSVEEEMEVVERYLDRLEAYSEKDDFEVMILYYGTQHTTRHLEYLRKSAQERGWELKLSDLDQNQTFGSSFYLTPEGHNRTAQDVVERLSGFRLR